MRSRRQLGFVVPPVAAASGGPVGMAIGAAVSLATLAIGALIKNSGCGPTCVLASNIVDQLEPELRKNRDAYLAATVRTPELQAVALANFDGAWAWLTSSQALGAPELGDAGRRGISDRARGGKWDWFAFYRDPIASDRPTPTLPAAAFPAAVVAEIAAVPQTWLLVAALILFGALFL